MYLAWRFSPVDNTHKSITACNAGDGVLAKTDVTQDENKSTSGAHNVTQTIQLCFEGNVYTSYGVGRIFMTVDYSALGFRVYVCKFALIFWPT